MSTYQNLTEDEKYNILNESFRTLRAKGVVKNWTEFAALIDVNRATLSAAKNGQKKYLTDSLISRVQGVVAEHIGNVSVSHSPGANVIAGNNNSIDVKNGNVSSLAPAHAQMRMVPTIPIHAYRAINFDVMEYFRNSADELHMSPIVMQFPGTDCYYFVNSDDMSPNLRTNDLLCLACLPADAKVTNGDLCIINTKYQGILERFVYDDVDALILKSTQERWTDMRIPKDEIFSIFRILGGIRTNI